MGRSVALRPRLATGLPSLSFTLYYAWMPNCSASKLSHDLVGLPLSRCWDLIVLACVERVNVERKSRSRSPGSWRRFAAVRRENRVELDQRESGRPDLVDTYVLSAGSPRGLVKLLSCGESTLPQQIELRPPIHLPLQQLQSRYLPFRLPV